MAKGSDNIEADKSPRGNLSSPYMDELFDVSGENEARANSESFESPYIGVLELPVGDATVNHERLESLSDPQTELEEEYSEFAEAELEENEEEVDSFYDFEETFDGEAFEEELDEVELGEDDEFVEEIDFKDEIGEGKEILYELTDEETLAEKIIDDLDDENSYELNANLSKDDLFSVDELEESENEEYFYEEGFAGEVLDEEENSYEDGLVEELEFETETLKRTILFPSGESLQIVSGPDANGERYYDPNHTNNPLLDTGGENRKKNLSRHFTVHELTKSGSTQFEHARIDPALVECLQAIRDKVGKSITVNSGYRSYAYNANIYRKRRRKPTKSRHCSGQAADIKVQGMSGYELAQLGISAYSPDIGVGIGANYIHIDVRGHWARWTYFGKGSEKNKTIIKRIDTYRRKHLGNKKTNPSLQKVEPTQDALDVKSVSLLEKVKASIHRGRTKLAVYFAWQKGVRDENKLTDLIFSYKHPELNGRKLLSEEKGLHREWATIRKNIVRPAIARLTQGSSARAKDNQPKKIEIDSTLSGSLPEQKNLGTLVYTGKPIKTGKGSAKLKDYSFTSEDLIWFARLLEGEAGGGKSSDLLAVAFTMLNKYAILMHHFDPTFHAFIRRYSTPLQKVLKSKGAAARHYKKKGYIKTGGSYPIDKKPIGKDIPRGQIQRHRDLQEKKWHKLSDRIRKIARGVLSGDIPNPGFGLATDFANTNIYWKQAQWRRDKNRYNDWQEVKTPSKEEWIDYTEKLARNRKWIWIRTDYLTVSSQMKNNAFFIDKRLEGVPADSVKVMKSSFF